MQSSTPSEEKITDVTDIFMRHLQTYISPTAQKHKGTFGGDTPYYKITEEKDDASSSVAKAIYNVCVMLEKNSIDIQRLLEALRYIKQFEIKDEKQLSIFLKFHAFAHDLSQKPPKIGGRILRMLVSTLTTSGIMEADKTNKDPIQAILQNTKESVRWRIQNYWGWDWSSPSSKVAEQKAGEPSSKAQAIYDLCDSFAKSPSYRLLGKALHSLQHGDLIQNDEQYFLFLKLHTLVHNLSNQSLLIEEQAGLPALMNTLRAFEMITQEDEALNQNPTQPLLNKIRARILQNIYHYLSVKVIQKEDCCKVKLQILLAETKNATAGIGTPLQGEDNASWFIGGCLIPDLQTLLALRQSIVAPPSIEKLETLHLSEKAKLLAQFAALTGIEDARSLVEHHMQQLQQATSSPTPSTPSDVSSAPSTGLQSSHSSFFTPTSPTSTPGLSAKPPPSSTLEEKPKSFGALCFAIVAGGDMLIIEGLKRLSTLLGIGMVIGGAILICLAVSALAWLVTRENVKEQIEKHPVRTAASATLALSILGEGTYLALTRLNEGMLEIDITIPIIAVIALSLIVDTIYQSYQQLPLIM